MNSKNLQENRRGQRGRKTIVFENALLIDGSGAAPQKGSTVIIRDGLIQAAAPGPPVKLPQDAQVIDLHGAALLPGFINAHVHEGFNARNLAKWAGAGVTTVRDLGADLAQPLFLRRHKLAKNNKLARLIAAGPILTEPGGYPFIPFGGNSALEIKSVKDAQLIVRRLLDLGADVIKIALERGRIFNRHIPVLGHRKARAVVKAAHMRGVRVSAHVTTARDLERAIAAGVDDVSHMAVDPVPARLFAKMARRNIFWVPTLELWKCVSRRFLKIALENLGRFVKAGGRVALGTDFEGYTCSWQGGMPLRELGLMLSAGLSPGQVITAATCNAAFVCGLEKRLGTVEPGKIADLLVVNGNPLEDMEALSDVRLVMKNGEILS